MAQPAAIPPSSETRGEVIHLPFAQPKDVWAKAIPWIVFAVSALVLGFNVAPGVTFHDSGEFALAAKVGGIPHPPGAPSWTLAAWIACSLLPFLEAAYVTNLLCSLYGAATLGLMAHLSIKWIEKSDLDLKPHFLALAAPLALLISPAFLEQSFITEQYTLLTFHLCLILTLATKATDETGLKAWQWSLFGIVWGLSMANHPSQICLGLLMLAFVFTLPGPVAWWQRSLWGLAGTVAGLSVFLYNPIRSSTNPIMNWGQPDNWERFFWGISRQQWKSRPIGDAPAGFVNEWLMSYNFQGELGWIVLGLSAIGMITLVRRLKLPLLWMTLAVVPYAVLLLLGHMKQMGMDNIYIRHYGVSDWHIPIYMMLALAASLGLARAAAFLQTRGRDVMIGGVLCVLAGLAGFSVYTNSMRDYKDAETYIENYLKSVPENATLFAASDNASHPLAYTLAGGFKRQDLTYAYGYPQFEGMNEVDSIFRWGAKTRRAWLTDTMHNWDYQPLDLPRLSEEQIDAPLYVEFPPAIRASAAFMEPSGWNFRMHDTVLKNDDVIASEEKWQQNHPELFAPAPTDRPIHRLTREAFSQVHQRRANYFVARNLLGSAVEAYGLALSWQPDNAQIWFGLGFAYDKADQPDEARKAFIKAYELMPYFPGVNNAMALASLEAGETDAAEFFFREEQRYFPGEKNSLYNLQRLEEQKKSGRAPIRSDFTQPDSSVER